MNYGLIHNESMEAYHATDCVSHGRLGDLSPYPIMFYKRWVLKEIAPDDPTDAMNFGAYFHCLALEGEDIAAERYFHGPKFDRRTKAGKEAEAVACASGKKWISEVDRALAWRMVRAIREKPSAVKLLSSGKPEITFRHKLASFSVQARVDWYDDADKAAPICVNLKTIDRLQNFDYQFHKLGYYRGDAFYRLVVAKVCGIETFQPQMIDLVVEKNEPFQVAIRTPDANSLQIGTAEVMGDLAKLKACYDSGIWPGEPDECRGISLPEWKIRASL